MRRESELTTTLTVITSFGRDGFNTLNKRYGEIFDAVVAKSDRRERKARTKLNRESPFFRV